MASYMCKALKKHHQGRTVEKEKGGRMYVRMGML